MRELQYLNKYFVKYKYHFLFGILITIVAQFFSNLTPNLVGDAINIIERSIKNPSNAAQAKKDLLFIILKIISFTLIAGALTFLMRQTLIVMSRYVEFDLKNEVFKHYEKLDQNFYKSNRTGDLMSRISEDVSKVRMYVGPAVMYAVNTFISFIVIVIFMGKVSWELTLFTLLPLPFLAVIIFKISVQINKRSTIFQQYLSKVNSFSQEIFSGLRVIKAYALESQNQEKMIDLAIESKEKSMNLARIQALFQPLMITLIGISSLIVIYVGGNMYINGQIEEIGTIATFILYVGKLTWPVASVGWVSSLVQEAAASQKRLNEFLKTQPEITNTVKTKSIINGEIEFKNISYTYDDTNIEALKNISFKINKGETLAILGKTGSGKSTILSLISRLYDINKGSITVDNNNIKNINLFDLRNSIGFVPQDSFLFSDTIKNNIKFGKENATSEEVIQAAKNAAVHNNIIQFTNGYETILGERGITLSGGQKQRVSIARAIIKEPSILLFDDCLSAVDTETEEEILNNLFQISKNKTTIIVSHRVSSVKNADKIIILDEGEIIQQGTHNQLLNTEGYYKELYYKQLSEKELK
jgi:ATP-binding cassette subfamily B multidrug efflux pump